MLEGIHKPILPLRSMMVIESCSKLLVHSKHSHAGPATNVNDDIWLFDVPQTGAAADVNDNRANRGWYEQLRRQRGMSCH